MSDSHGLTSGDVCNRDSCKGLMIEQDKDTCCSCHINPPCSHCVDMIYECDECGSETEPPSLESTSTTRVNTDSPWMRIKTPQEVFNGLPDDVFGYITIPGAYYWMEYKGKYPESMGSADIVEKFNTCFGYKWIKEPGNGVFHIKVYTD